MEIERFFMKLEEISDWVSNEVDNEIRSSLEEDCELVQVFESIQYTFLYEGKRKRAVMVYLCYLLKKESVTKDLRYLATFIELMQTASLVHDDIIDDSSFRRGKETVNKRYGNNTALITGDFLIFKAFKLLASLDSKYYKRITNILGNTFMKMCYGQEVEKNFIGNLNVDVESYKDMIYMKTGVFIERICECAFVLADADIISIDIIRNFGRYYGMAYQIKDDMKFFIDEEKDKSLESDVDRRLVTLPIIYALKNSNIYDKEYLINVYKEEMYPDYERIRKIVIDSQALKEAQIYYNSLIEKAISELKKIEASEALDMILMFVGGANVEELKICLI